MSEMLKKLRRSIQNKRRGVLTKGIVLLCDAAPHCGSHKCFNQALQLGDFRSCSLQSGPGAKRLPSLQQDEGLVGTQRFHTNEELMDGVNNWLHNLAAPFCDEGLQKLVSGYDKCLNWDGNYVVK